jgi:hypothetical protein
MCGESVCQVARSWVEVGSFRTRLFGVVYVTRGDFHDRSEKGTESVHQILCQMVKGHRNKLEQLQYNIILNVCTFGGVIINVS